MYGESEYAQVQNNLYEVIKIFLEEGHPVSELLSIVSDVLEREVEYSEYAEKSDSEK